MSPDRIAEVTPMIGEMLDAPAGTSLCATFEAAGNDSAWMQVMPGLINAAHPDNENPGIRLAAHLANLPCAGISEWQRMKFVTFTCMPDGPEGIARLVGCLLVDLFDSSDYLFECRVSGALITLLSDSPLCENTQGLVSCEWWCQAIGDFLCEIER